MIYHRITLPTSLINICYAHNDYSHKMHAPNTEANITVCLKPRGESLENFLAPFVETYPTLRICLIDTNCFEGSEEHIVDVTRYYNKSKHMQLKNHNPQFALRRT